MRKFVFTGRSNPFSKAVIIVFFIAYLLSGLFLAGDYGIHWDDHAQYNHGKVNVDYISSIFGTVPAGASQADFQLDEYKDRSHGVVFQVFAMSVQEVLGLDDPRDFFLLRHYLTFLIFFTGLIFFYRLIKLQFKSKWLALLGVIMMILSPRIFADSFYNSKDIVFLSLTIINIWTLARFLQNPGFASASFHAIAGAFLISTRIIGVFMPAVSLLFTALIIFGSLNRKNEDRSFYNNGSPKRMIWSSGLYMALLLLLTIGLWPYLWEDPIRRIAEIFTTMSHFNWDDAVLFRGRFMIPGNLPFYYIPFWILITTPLLYTVLFLAGLVSIFRHEKGSPGWFVHLNVVLFFFPMLAVVLLGSVVYDGWRQMFFLYVPFMILAMAGLDYLYRTIAGRLGPKISRYFKIALTGVIFISLVNTAFFMIRYHPHQNVYFNCLAGKETTRDFESDYWGLSYRQVLQNLLEKYPGDTLKVLSVNWPGKANADILPSELRSRLIFTGPDSADIYISNYRFPAEHDKFFTKAFPYDRPIVEIEVRGNKIAGAYRYTR